MVHLRCVQALTICCENEVRASCYSLKCERMIAFKGARYSNWGLFLKVKGLTI